MTSLVHDLRIARRSWRERPLPALLAFSTLALGLGLVLSVYGLARSIVLRPLPFPEPDTLVQVQRAFDGVPTPNVSARQAIFWQEHTDAFASFTLYAWLPQQVVRLGGARPERLEAYRVDARFFETFGARPVLGRLFDAEEARPGGGAVALLSHTAWLSRWGGDPAVVGRTVELDGVAHQIVGVVEPDFRYPTTAELWLPLQIDRATTDVQAIYSVTARLRGGVDAAAAQERLATVEAEYLRLHGDPDRNETVAVRSLARDLYGDLRPRLSALGGTALLVLAIATANTGALQLAMHRARERERRTRLALGARPLLLVRQVVVESLLLASAAGLAALAVARLSLPLVAAILPPGTQLFGEVTLGGSSLVLLFGLATAVALVAAAVPAVRTARRRTLGLGTRSEPSGTNRGAGAALVAAEASLCVVALVASLLLIRSYTEWVGQDSGLRASGVLTAQATLPAARYTDASSWEPIQERLVPELAALPGVEHAAAATYLPLEDGPDLTFTVVGRDPEAPDGNGYGQILGVTPGYFATLGVPLVSSRAFAPADRPDSEPVVIVNQTLARQTWPDSDPVGETLWIGPPSMAALGDPEPRRIVGVAGDVREDGLAYPPPPMLYLPLAQLPDGLASRFPHFRPLALMLTTSVSPRSLEPQVAQVVWSTDASLPVFGVRTLEERLAATAGPLAALARLVVAFAITASLLSAVGIYGIVAHRVAQRRREIGLRLTLGASRAGIVGWTLRGTGWAVLSGAGLGLLLARSSTRLLEELLLVDSTDPISYMAALLVLLAVACVAGLVPSWRALRVDPARTLRHE